MSQENLHSSLIDSIDSKPGPARRKLLGWLVAGINLVVFGVVVGPVLGFLGSPLGRKAKGVWVPVGRFDEIKDGQTLETSFSMKVKDGYATVDRKYTIFLRRKGDSVIAFDPACTHLGCRINWVGDKNRYFCPCHGGVFDSDGAAVSGPPPKPLEQHPVKVENGQIFVQKLV